jgi:hypothetical protein
MPSANVSEESASVPMERLGTKKRGQSLETVPLLLFNAGQVAKLLGCSMSTDSRTRVGCRALCGLVLWFVGTGPSSSDGSRRAARRAEEGLSWNGLETYPASAEESLLPLR